MAVNRADAKAGATNAENTDPQFKFAQEQGGNLRVALEKEANRHREAMAKGERGRIGNLLGNSDFWATQGNRALAFTLTALG